MTGETVEWRRAGRPAEQGTAPFSHRTSRSHDVGVTATTCSACEADSARMGTTRPYQTTAAGRGGRTRRLECRSESTTSSSLVLLVFVDPTVILVTVAPDERVDLLLDLRLLVRVALRSSPTVVAGERSAMSVSHMVRKLTQTASAPGCRPRCSRFRHRWTRRCSADDGSTHERGCPARFQHTAREGLGRGPLTCSSDPSASAEPLSLRASACPSS